MKTNGVFLLQESVTLPYNNFDKSKTNKNPKNDLATSDSPETRVAGKKNVFWGFVTIEANKRQTN